jgi:hypothetical protein
LADEEQLGPALLRRSSYPFGQRRRGAGVRTRLAAEEQHKERR